MIDKLFDMTLEAIQHRGKRLFFDGSGIPYYGPDELNLIHPGGLDIQARFPLYLADVVNAFKLGVQAGLDGKKSRVVADELSPSQARAVTQYHNRIFHDGKPTANIDAGVGLHKYDVVCYGCVPEPVKEGF